MRLILVLLIIGSINAHAGDDWFCTGEASKMQGESVKACGQGNGSTQMIAKMDAFLHARLEFWYLCQASDTCRGYPVSIIPGRETCNEKKYDFGGYPSSFKWRCDRMLTFTVDRSGEPCDESGKDRFKGCPMNRMPE